MHTAARRVAPNIIIIALGLAAALTAAGYGVLGDDGRIGPGFLPAVAGTLMAVFAAVNLVTSRTRAGTTLESVVESQIPGLGSPETAPKGPDVGPGDTDIYGRTQRQRDRMLWIVVGIVLSTVLLVPLLGFLIAFAALLLVIAVAVEKRKILPSILVSVVTLGVTYAIFVMFLRVPLPQGIFGI